MGRLSVAILVFTILPIGCSDSPRSNSVQGRPSTSSSESQNQAAVGTTAGSNANFLPLTKGEVSVDINVVSLPNRRVRIRGTTNLPADTQLLLSVEEKAPSGFNGQSKCSVTAKGFFESEPFGPQNGLPVGIYTAEVIMPIPRVQPPQVQQIIGANGENLSGPLVEKSKYGVTVKAIKEFTVGSVEAKDQQQQRTTDRIKQSQEWCDRIQALDRRLQSAREDGWLRDPTNHDNLAKWGQFARQFRQDLQALDEEVMRIQPVSVRLTIGTPLGDIGEMFSATAFQKESDYQSARKSYEEGLKKLKEFIQDLSSGKVG